MAAAGGSCVLAGSRRRRRADHDPHDPERRPRPGTRLRRHGAASARDQSAAQANNPLANSTALNFRTFYTGELEGIDRDADQVLIRYAQPFSDFGADLSTPKAAPSWPCCTISFRPAATPTIASFWDRRASLARRRRPTC